MAKERFISPKDFGEILLKQCNVDMQQGHAEMTCSMDMQYGHAAWTCSMDMWHEHACSKDITIGMQRGHAA